jgi:hypothetical protein
VWFPDVPVSSAAGRSSSTVGLWITDPAAPEPTPTKDVDAIVGVTSCGRFYEFEEFLRWHGFREDADMGVICRWRHHELMLDVMPTDASILPAPQ